MKNLANCKPTEFLQQTNRIRKVAEKWLNETGILNIRKNMPAIPKDATEEEKNELMQAQVKKNLSIMDKHPNETLELLALICFVEPKDVDEHEMSEYIDAITEVMSNKSVLRFFTSLVQLGQMNI